MSTVANGYDAKHKRRRVREQRTIDLGEGVCARCGLPIWPGQHWDLGHNDFDRSIYSGPEHRYSRDCPAGGNRATAGRRNWQAKMGKRRSQEW